MTDQECQEFWASLCLRHSPGLGPRTARRILEHFGCAARAVDQARAWYDAGLATAQQCQAFTLESWREDAEKELRAAEGKALQVLGWADARYPRRLREIPDPPLFLYWSGNVELLDAPAVAVVGSRDCSRYGVDLARRIARELSGQGVTVVSGLAQGIDREAHLGGLEGPGGSVAVMGTGPDLIYPSANRDVWRSLAEGGLILSEFPPGTKPLAGNFPLRNRIISGLSLGVLVVEASTRSGSLITARLAMEQGRDVFAVPGPVSLPSYRGCHEIINRGARLVHCAQDILEELKPQLEAYLTEKGVPARPPRPRCAAVRGSLLPQAAPAPPVRTGRGAARKGAEPSGPDKAFAGGPIASGQPDAMRSGPGASGPGVAAPAGRGAPGQRAPRQGRRASSRGAAAAFAIARPDAPGVPPAHDPVLDAGADGGLEANLAGHLAAAGATHIDALCRIFGRDAKDLSRTLVVLELKGVVRRLPGGYYLTA
ncbi:DNA processing protein DprA [Fundidesulfovibrio magnetotacticus]|uniref:DNA processing protein DprA n=1 Tax=Fundidesulfovibrio magnetotacticus TaxID=2730080 RepID=A0A6V8LZ70_9BACT|nr:DNA-processing protein DprA [Fundidesulfovibrio magnetotacticus]GFK95528.1 DNA processing protein DprA [Fundidesulfovibrio magnetotacticus]